MKVAVVGGGIAGLASAYYLVRVAQEEELDLDITLLESADYWGGKIKTEVEDGFVVEGGPDAYLVTKPWMRALAVELGLEDDLQGTNPDYSETYILHRGRLASIPTGLTMTIPTEFGPMIKTRLLSWPQKMRLGLDLLLPPSKHNGDESLAGFITRRLGRPAYEKLIGPLLSGIYAGDGDRLSLQSTFPMLRDMELEHGGLVRGALALRRKRAAMRAKRPAGTNSKSIFESPRSGLASIVDALVERLEGGGVELRLGTTVGTVSQQGDGYSLELTSGENITIDGLVLGTPAFVSAGLLNGIYPELCAQLEQIEYVTTATVSLAYRREDIDFDLDGYGYIIPQHEDSKALACTWTSSKWRHRAPDDHVLLRVFVGRIQDAESLPHEEDELVQMACLELEETMGITTPPMRSWVFRWEKAMPQYNLGHPERLERIEQELARVPRLALAGGGYTGIGMPDCVRSGRAAAEKIKESLKDEHSYVSN